MDPRVLICDEAVAALDGTARREILRLLQSEQERTGLSLIFITHDLSVASRMSHRVLVMYMGRLLEYGPTRSLFRTPRHPYTRALLDAVPVADHEISAGSVPVSGEIPSAISPPPGCPYQTRCSYALDVCREKLPPLADGVACHRAGELVLER